MSFVCNTQLYVVRISTRPYLEINFDQSTNEAAKFNPLSGDYDQTALAFNNFNLTLSVFN